MHFKHLIVLKNNAHSHIIFFLTNQNLKIIKAKGITFKLMHLFDLKVFILK